MFCYILRFKVETEVNGNDLLKVKGEYQVKELLLSCTNSFYNRCRSIWRGGGGADEFFEMKRGGGFKTT